MTEVKEWRHFCSKKSIRNQIIDDAIMADRLNKILSKK